MDEFDYPDGAPRPHHFASHHMASIGQGESYADVLRRYQEDGPRTVDSVRNTRDSIDNLTHAMVEAFADWWLSLNGWYVTDQIKVGILQSWKTENDPDWFEL